MAERRIAHPRLNAHKALEVLLYVARQCPKMYWALKVIYFADRQHLTRYGRLIAGDRYVAMRHGPVPSATYDLIKSVRGDGVLAMRIPADEAFAMRDNIIVPLRDPDLNALSESDKECLDESIQRYGRMPFGELKALSHDEAYDAADRDDFIPMETLVKSLQDGEALWEYLNQ